MALTLMGPHKVLLEFDQKSDVVGSSLKMHGPHVWDGINVNINCLVAPESSLIDMYYERLQLKGKKKSF